MSIYLSPPYSCPDLLSVGACRLLPFSARPPAAKQLIATPMNSAPTKKATIIHIVIFCFSTIYKRLYSDGRGYYRVLYFFRQLQTSFFDEDGVAVPPFVAPDDGFRQFVFCRFCQMLAFAATVALSVRLSRPSFHTAGKVRKYLRRCRFSAPLCHFSKKGNFTNPARYCIPL